MAVGRSADATQWQKLFRFVELAGPLACPAGTVGHDVCDQQMWPTLEAQFGATGPTCGAPDPAVDGATSTPGCCDARDAAPPFGVVLFTWLVTWTLGRARRH
jgi:hypothetical protein